VLIVTLTNERLEVTHKMLKYFGIMILATHCQFSNRRDLWNTVPSHPYDVVYNFRPTGMTRHCFDTLHANIRHSRQLENRPVGMSSECYRWTLVDDFITNFNNQRASQFNPSHLICIDESMSRWYGQGGEWINHGLPFYFAIDRKPENGCEIQSACCGKSGVMIQLRLMKLNDALRKDSDCSLLLLGFGGGHNYAIWLGSPSNAACNAPIVAAGSANCLQMLVYTHYGHPQLVAYPSKGQGAPIGLLKVVVTMQLGPVHHPMQHAMRQLLPPDQQTASKC
jgi:Transposase IS4